MLVLSSRVPRSWVERGAPCSHRADAGSRKTVAHTAEHQRGTADAADTEDQGAGSDGSQPPARWESRSSQRAPERLSELPARPEPDLSLPQHLRPLPRAIDVGYQGGRSPG